MLKQHEAYEIDDDADRFDISRVQQWLATTYWWGDTANVKMVKRAFAHSALAIGVYHNNAQVACARVVSDKTRFAWLADVYVTPEHRQRGLARAMTRFIIEHPECQTITRFLLITRDAHEIYAAVGFQPLPDPERWMQFRPPADAAR